MKFETELEKAKQWTLGTLKNRAAAELQKAIRAEAGADLSPRLCVKNGEVTTIAAPIGYAVCVTCGVMKPWKGAKNHGIDGIDAGHFLPSRRNSILFDERGIHPQCSHENRTGGAPKAYQQFMAELHGQEVIDELHALKHQGNVTFDREQLVTMRRAYRERWKLAVKQMEAG